MLHLMEHPLRVLRAAKDISLEDLAEISGLSKASLSRIETGLQQPSFDMIKKLVAVSADLSDTPLTPDDFVNFPLVRDAATQEAAA